MRALPVLLISAVSLLPPALANADPAQPQQPSASASATSAAMPAPAATAQQSAPATQMTQAPAAPAPETAANGANLDEIVCKSEPPQTGTRLGGSRECHTVRQWNERMRQDQRMTQIQENVGSHLSN
ncbi:MAG TPA: hypothetical protein VMF67_03825 [Rhizomicrobium sp.]|nr:hypothetical protein [Rhizomicrobium sp.]